MTIKSPFRQIQFPGSKQPRLKTQRTPATGLCDWRPRLSKTLLAVALPDRFCCICGMNGQSDATYCALTERLPNIYATRKASRNGMGVSRGWGMADALTTVGTGACGTVGQRVRGASSIEALLLKRLVNNSAWIRIKCHPQFHPDAFTQTNRLARDLA